jgi:hypothetical protein
MMYPEYGACVHIHPGIARDHSGETGMIVGVTPFPHEYLVRVDELHYIMNVSEFDVTLAPSVAAYNLCTRHSADEVLEAIEGLAAITDAKWAVYQAALVFEVIRLNHYAEAGLTGWESGSCSAGCDVEELPLRVVNLDTDSGEVTFFTLRSADDEE